MPAPIACACPGSARPACHGEPTHKHEGAHYCLFHWPSAGKAREFKEALEAKLGAGDYDFRGVWFPAPLHLLGGRAFETRIDFSQATFNGGVYFVNARFKAEAMFAGAVFKVGAMFYDCVFDQTPVFNYARFETEANFTSAHFKRGADFRSATFIRKAMFAGADFYKNHEATFEMAMFEQEAHFEAANFWANANFEEAVFQGEVRFIKTTFAIRASFNKVTFRDYVRFEGNEGHRMFNEPTLTADTLRALPRLELRWARIENPRRVFFESLILRPHWFVKVVNARDLNFSNVKWVWGSTREEIERVKDSGVPAPREALEITCRQLADNANDNHLYEDASGLRFIAMETRRSEKWRGFVPYKLSWWYWLASGYGERVWQAAAWLACIWLLWASLYVSMGFPRWPKVAPESQDTTATRVGTMEAWSQALVYSAGVMTLQRPEPRPTTTAAQALVVFETILGPIQGALLALAIRRKFMG